MAKKKTLSKKEVQKKERLAKKPEPKKIKFTERMAMSLINNEEHRLRKREGKDGWSDEKKQELCAEVVKCTSQAEAVKIIAKKK